MRNVENYLELLYSYTHDVFQLHLSSEIGPFERSGVNFVENSHQIKCVTDRGMISFRRKIWVLLFDISELSGPFGFILYSFEVLISTIELPSISSIGPLTMKIIWFLYFVTGHPVRCTYRSDVPFRIRLTYDLRSEKHNGDVSSSPVVRWSWYFTVR